MNIEQFLKAFEKKVKAMPKSDMKWKLKNIKLSTVVYQKAFIGKRIRGYSKASDRRIENRCCPLAFLEGNYNSLDFESAAKKFGINAIDAEKIVMAADGDPGHDPILRKAMLAIVGLKE